MDQLRGHVRLLKEYADRAFRQGDPMLLGEVAGKLRLLVHESRLNRPLLLSLMDTFEADIRIVLDRPPVPPPPSLAGSGHAITLREYLSRPAIGIRTPTGFRYMTKAELIRTWASQRGAAHEDRDLDERFKATQDIDLYVGEPPALVRELILISTAVINSPERFLNTLTPERVASAEIKQVARSERRSAHDRTGLLAKGGMTRAIFGS